VRGRSYVFLLSFAVLTNLHARCLTKLIGNLWGRPHTDSEQTTVLKETSPNLAQRPKNSENWKPLLDRVSGDAVAKEKFFESLQAYDATQSAEYADLKNFLESDAGKQWKISVFNREGPSESNASAKTIKIYIDAKNEGAVAFTDSQNKVYPESAAHTFFHELWHAKDSTEQHPASVQVNADVFENPVNQLSREYRANLAAYASPEAAWHITDARYTSRVRNIEQLIPAFKTLDLASKVKLLDRLATLPEKRPDDAKNLHAYWWSKKYGNSWNEDERTRYVPDAAFDPQSLVRGLLAEIAVE